LIAIVLTGSLKLSYDAMVGIRTYNRLMGDRSRWLFPAPLRPNKEAEAGSLWPNGG
jgi:hypothetical protein